MLIFIQILSTSSTDGITKSQLFRSLGIMLNNVPPPLEHRQEVLKNVWSVISTFTDASEYITCVEIWSQYIAKYFGVSFIFKLNVFFFINMCLLLVMCC